MFSSRPTSYSQQQRQQHFSMIEKQTTSRSCSCYSADEGLVTANPNAQLACTLEAHHVLNRSNCSKEGLAKAMID
jgi:hypothetical protein